MSTVTERVGSISAVSVALIVLVLLVVIPVGFLITMSGVAALLGWVTKSQVDAAFEGTEDLAISREPSTTPPDRRPPRSVVHPKVIAASTTVREETIDGAPITR